MKIRLCLFMFLSVLLTCHSQVFAGKLQNIKVGKKIDKLINQTKENLNIAIQIQDLNNGKVIYKRNPKRLMSPASNFKVFTSVASLLYFGSSFRYRTYVLTDARHFRKGVMEGNLYFKFNGDPSFRYADLERFVMDLKEMGLKTVSGNIYLDDTAFKHRNIGKGWMWDDLPYCYSAPVNAMNLDHNCFSFKIKPADKIGHLASIEPLHLSIFTPLENNVVTKAVPSNKCHIKVNASRQNKYSIEGCISSASDGEEEEIAISNVEQYVKDMLSFALHQYGIQVNGKIILGETPDDKTRRLAVHSSEPFWALNGKMMKESDNLYAESFLKKLGASVFHKTGSWYTGTKALKKILKEEAGIDMAKSKLSGGSGLSRYTLINADQLSRLLYYAYHNFFIEPELMSALPIAGEDGTLRRRMKEKWMDGRVRAKTGSMAGVSTLSGYLVTEKDHVLSFVILVNGFSGSIYKYRALEDDICRTLVKMA